MISWHRGLTLGERVFVLFALVLVFGVTECATGSTHQLRSQVVGRHYHPPYTSVRLVCSSSNNHTRCRPVTDYHPARYVLALPCEDHVAEVDDRSAFYRLREGDRSGLSFREGRWTRVHYLHWVTP